MQFCGVRNRAGGQWKFSVTKYGPDHSGKEGVLVKRVSMAYKRGDQVAGNLINTDGMAYVRAQQWERLAFVFDSVHDHAKGPVVALIELEPDLARYESKLRTWLIGGGVITNDDEAIIAMCEKAIAV